MGKRKLSYDEIRIYLGLFNYTLLSEKYTGSREKIKVKCHAGHVSSIFFINFFNGHRCKKCASKNEALSYDYVKGYIEKFNYTLLSETYENANSKLDIMCNNGHRYRVTFHHFKEGRRCSKCSPRGRPRILDDRIIDLDICLYDVYHKKLSIFENCYRDEENKLYLNVECAFCGKIFRPTRRAVTTRIRCFDGKTKGESRFYCSEKCKQFCPTYRQKKYRKDESQLFKDRYGGIVWRNMVLERDGYKCRQCGFYSQDGTGLDVHHIEPSVCAPALSCDIENGITLCENCHKSVHKKDGCTYFQLSEVV